MSAEIVDVEALLREIDEAQPAGQDCEYDPKFFELEKAAQGRPERQVGDTIQPATPAEWRDVLPLATGLFDKTKDLRVSMYLCRALLGLHGLPGLAGGLEVLLGVLERYWPALYPQLDPDDDNDPTMRVNVIAGLNHHETMLQPIRDSWIVSARAVGRFTLRQAVAANASNPPEGAPDSAIFEAAFLECDLDELRRTTTATQQALATVRRIEAFLTDQVGASNAADFSPIIGVLREASALLTPRLAARDGGAAPAGADAPAVDEVSEGQVPVGAVAPAAAVRVAGPGVLASREDVVRTLDKICEYYAKTEPSSPVPLLLQRAKRLVGLDFMDLLRDLTPDGVSQFATISGIRRDD